MLFLFIIDGTFLHFESTKGEKEHYGRKMKT